MPADTEAKDRSPSICKATTKKYEATSQPTVQSKKKKGQARIRNCLKEEPLQPLYTGNVKKPKKSKKPTKKNPVPKLTVTRPKANIPTKKDKGTKSKKMTKTGTLPQIRVESPESQSEVVFRPRTDCAACDEGRKGEGDNSCWGCRLARLSDYY